MASNSKLTRSKSTSSTQQVQTMEELLAQNPVLSHVLKRGQTTTGTIVFISPREILIDVGAKSEGIVSGRELSQIRGLAKQLKVGDKIDVQVIQPENEHGQVILSLRPLADSSSWEEVENKRKSGEAIRAKTLDLVRGGMLVDVLVKSGAPLRGFLPVSQMTSATMTNQSSVIGDYLQVKILEVDRSNDRLVVSEKGAATASQKSQIAEKLNKFKISQTVDAKITAIVPFGIFVLVDDDVEGMIHISEVAWEKVDDLPSKFAEGQTVKAEVISIDRDQARLNLSLRLLQDNPWQGLVEKYPKGKAVSGQVTKATAFGVFISLEPGIEGLLHNSKIPAGTSYKTGDDINCEIESVDPGKRRIGLSPVLKEKPITYR